MRNFQEKRDTCVEFLWMLANFKVQLKKYYSIMLSREAISKLINKLKWDAA